MSSSTATTATTIESISCSVGSTICFPTFGCGHVIAYSGSNNEYVIVLRASPINIDSSYRYSRPGDSINLGPDYVNYYINSYYKLSIIESMPNTTYVGMIGYDRFISIADFRNDYYGAYYGPEWLMYGYGALNWFVGIMPGTDIWYASDPVTHEGSIRYAGFGDEDFHSEIRPVITTLKSYATSNNCS